MTSDLVRADATQGQRSTRWLDRAILCATLLTCAIALAPNVPDPDLWGHVQYGRDWLAQGFHTTTTYSYTAEGYRWVNHENLAELVSVRKFIASEFLRAIKELAGGKMAISRPHQGESVTLPQ